jgi:hypothetical protein
MGEATGSMARTLMPSNIKAATTSPVQHFHCGLELCEGVKR